MTSRSRTPSRSSSTRQNLKGEDALHRLQDGNTRFVGDTWSIEQGARSRRRVALANSQEPFAVILGCADSRVPAELVFDQDLGDLFVIRVAGNIVAPSQVGSIEFAVERFGTPLVVVLGHTRCGAVQAALDGLMLERNPDSMNLNSIVGRIQPAIQTRVWTAKGRVTPQLIQDCVRDNVRASANQLRHGSALLEQRVLEGKLTIVEAEYDLETGAVDFFELTSKKHSASKKATKKRAAKTVRKVAAKTSRAK